MRRHHRAGLGTLGEQTEKIPKKNEKELLQDLPFSCHALPPPQPRAGPKVCSGLPAGFVFRTKAAVPPIIKVDPWRPNFCGPAQVKMTCSQPAPEMDNEDISRPNACQGIHINQSSSIHLWHKKTISQHARVSNISWSRATINGQCDYTPKSSVRAVLISNWTSGDAESGMVNEPGATPRLNLLDAQRVKMS